MVEEIQQFGSLCIARRADGKAVEISRSQDELVFLAFDTKIRRLVELHVLRAGGAVDAAAKRSAFDRARQASEIRSHSFMRILEVGEDNGLVYYTSNLNDGEFVQDYIARRGALSASTAFAMIHQLLDDLLLLKKAGYQRLVSRMRLSHLLVGTLEDTFLQLRVFDYGLSQPDTGGGIDSGRLVAELCDVVFLLLTGQVYRGENPDRFPTLTQLPMNLRTTLRAALTDPLNAPASLEKLREDVREAFSSLTSSSQGRNLRKHLVVIGPLQPCSQLQEILLENVPVQTMLGNRFKVEAADNARRYPFSVPAVNVKTDQQVTVHMLPPGRIVEKTKYEAVPLQMWRFDAARHPNILRSLSLWESPDWTFLTEEREPGFTLSRLMAERVALNPGEVVVLMRQVRAGLEQAVECGVPRVDLHPSNILLRVGKNGPAMAREQERLMQKRLDAWPPFTVKLRPHLTMRSLYEPLLVDLDPESSGLDEHLRDRDCRHRSFVTLAAYLLAGERHMGGALQFAETVPEATAVFVREAVDLSQVEGRAPSPAEFLEKFEATMSAPAVDLATRLRGDKVALEDMESVGAVSDFEEEWSSSEEEAPQNPVARAKSSEFRSYAQPSGGVPWIVWAAAAVIFLGFGAWYWLDRPVGVVAQSPLPPASQQAEGPSSTPKAVSPPPVASVNVSTAKAPPVKTAPDIVSTSPQVRTEAIKAVDATKAVSAPLANSPAPLKEPVGPPPAATPTPSSDMPPKQAGKEPVMIRKAILPTKEELERMKQGHVQHQVGQLPSINTASPLPPGRN
ncbi:MAG: hypothetical protein JNG86_13525 [Verrucomicrobiaceae bacterium]|nr:hypothetical protein [Verrucomicrobiaceae bacterium]